MDVLSDRFFFKIKSDAIPNLLLSFEASFVSGISKIV
ncbi:hypothetical protein CJ739_1806 [Mariniflexile rhizosphaerae]|nr:hypothetical protein CJ739_1806 [Mariniflexile sp. TRM1-10]